MRSPVTRRQFSALAAVALLTAGAYVLRVDWVENQTLGFACEASDSLECSARQGLVMAFHYQLFGWGGLVLGALGLIWPRYSLAVAGLAVSALGIVFYNVDPASVGAVFALIALARSRVPAAPAAG